MTCWSVTTLTFLCSSSAPSLAVMASFAARGAPRRIGIVKTVLRIKSGKMKGKQGAACRADGHKRKRGYRERWKTRRMKQAERRCVCWRGELQLQPENECEAEPRASRRKHNDKCPFNQVPRRQAKSSRLAVGEQGLHLQLAALCRCPSRFFSGPPPVPSRFPKSPPLTKPHHSLCELLRNLCACASFSRCPKKEIKEKRAYLNCSRRIIKTVSNWAKHRGENKNGKRNERKNAACKNSPRPT